MVTNTLMVIEGILPKGPYLPCVSMEGRALLVGYPRNALLDFYMYCVTPVIISAMFINYLGNVMDERKHRLGEETDEWIPRCLETFHPTSPRSTITFAEKSFICWSNVIWVAFSPYLLYSIYIGYEILRVNRPLRLYALFSVNIHIHSMCWSDPSSGELYIL